MFQAIDESVDPRPDRRRFTRVLAVVALSGVPMLALVSLSMAVVDQLLVWVVYDLPKWAKEPFQTITKLGEAHWHLMALAALLGVSLWRGWRLVVRRAALGLASLAAAGVLVNILKVLIGRYRPKLLFEDAQYGFSPLSFGYDVSSFPSGHSTISGAVMAVLWLNFPKLWGLWLLLGSLVGLSRVMTRSHFLSDVLAGLWLGAAVSVILHGWWKSDRPLRVKRPS